MLPGVLRQVEALTQQLEAATAAAAGGPTLSARTRPALSASPSAEVGMRRLSRVFLGFYRVF